MSQIAPEFQLSVAMETPRAAIRAARPAYLLPKERIEVRAEHAALVVAQPPAPPRWIPIGRIDRIVCNQHVDWTGSALQLCMARGITISFSGRRDQTAGYLLPHVADEQTLNACLERFVSQPGAGSSLDNWLRHRRMQVLREWAHKRISHGHSVGTAEFCDLKRRWVYRSEVTPMLAPHMVNVCRAAVLARLHAAGALPSYVTAHGKTYPLLEMLAQLVWGEMNLDAGILAASCSDECAQLVFVEGWISNNRESVAKHLRALAVFVGKKLHIWH